MIRFISLCMVIIIQVVALNDIDKKRRVLWIGSIARSLESTSPSLIVSDFE